MPVLEARTTVYRPPAVVFDALSDLRRYEAYSTHLASVERDGDGGVGTEYDLRFEWWRVTYAVRSRVTAVDRPTRLDFEVVRGLAASGSWLVEPVEARSDGAAEPSEAGVEPADRVDEPSDAVDEPSDVDAVDVDLSDSSADGATRVTFLVRYDPDTVAASTLQLPALTPLSWVIDKVAPLVEREARGVVERVVQDLEGSQREVDLEVVVRSGAA